MIRVLRVGLHALCWLVLPYDVAPAACGWVDQLLGSRKPRAERPRDDSEKVE